MATAAIRVKGLNELQRAFGKADRALRQDLRDALQEAAAPVRSEAQSLAGTQISGLRASAPWSRMRIGMAGGSVVYVAPVERGVKGGQGGGAGRRRANRLFADRLLDEAMEIALQNNRRQIERRIYLMLGEVAQVWERA